MIKIGDVLQYYTRFLLFMHFRSGIPSYWDFQTNLLGSMNEDDRQNKYNWLLKQIKKLKQEGPDKEKTWRGYFRKV